MAQDPELPRSDQDPIAVPARGPWRYALIVFGWAMVGAGVVGVVLPVVPSTPFFLLALWAFSRSSQRFHDWLYHHPVLGPPLRDFARYRVVPAPVKAIAAMAMASSLVYVGLFTAAPIYAVAVMAAVMAVVLVYLLRCPSRKPERD